MPSLLSSTAAQLLTQQQLTLRASQTITTQTLVLRSEGGNFLIHKVQNHLFAVLF